MLSSCCSLSTLSFLCTVAFSSWYRFLSLPFASLFSLTVAKVSSDIHFFFFCNLTHPIVSLATSSRTLLVTFPEIFWGYLIHCRFQCRKPVGHLYWKLHCFLFLEFLEIRRRNAVLSLSTTAYLSCHLQTRHSARHLPSSGTPCCHNLPPGLTLRARLRHAAPSVWNSLPRTVLDSPSLTVFKSRLKTYLFHLANTD